VAVDPLQVLMSKLENAFLTKTWLADYLRMNPLIIMFAIYGAVGKSYFLLIFLQDFGDKTSLVSFYLTILE